MYGGMGSAVTPDLSKGGEIDGDLVITGDFKVEGAGSFSYDEIIQGTAKFEGDVTIESSGGSFVVKNTGTGTDADADITLIAGAGGVNADFWKIKSDHSDNKLYFINGNDTRGTFTSSGTFAVTEKLKVDAVSGSHGILGLESGTGNEWLIVSSVASNNLDFYNGTPGTVMTITKDTARVGIGTLSPSYKLDIVQSGDYQFRVGSSANKYVSIEDDVMRFKGMTGNGMRILTIDSSDINFGTNTTLNRLVIKSDGNVGIGTSSPRGVLGNVTLDTKNIYIGVNGALHGSINSDDSIYMNFDANNSNTNAGFFVTTNGVGTTGTKLFAIDDNSRISLSNNDSGTSNTIFGKSAGANLDAGSNYNTFIGEIVSDASMDDASDNVGVGYGALGALTQGDNNVAIGSLPLQSNTTGGNNIGIGITALRYNATGVNNVAIGSYSQRGASGQNHSNNTSVGFNSLYAVTTGGENIAIGSASGDAITTGSRNVTIGRYAGSAITTGSHNIAIGYASLDAVTTTSSQIAIGDFALSALTSGLYNVAIGTNAGKLMTANSSNTIIGDNAFISADGNEDKNVVIGAGAGDQMNSDQIDNNVIIGKEAWRGGTGLLSASVVIGSEAGKTPHVRNVYDSVFIGHRVAYSEFGGGCNYNVGIGTLAMSAGNLNDAHGNVAVGWKAMEALTQSDNNVAIGRESLKSILAGAGGNIALGYLSGRDVNSGTKNVYIGYQAGMQQTSGSGSINIGNLAGQVDSSSPNTIIGSGAFASSNNSSSGSNVIVGYESGAEINHADSTDNVIIGRGAGRGGAGEFTNNIAIGSYALDGTTTNDIDGSVAIGHYALTAVTSGGYNTAIGYQAGKALTTGGNNTAVGYGALDAENSGVENVAIGTNALGQATGGVQQCTAVGHGSLQNQLVTSGDNPSGATGIGFEAGYNVTSAIGFTAIGWRSGYTNSGADKSTFIGYASGYRGNFNHNNTYVGYYAGLGASGGGGGENNCGLGANVLENVNGANANVAMGYQSLQALSTGDINVALGYQSAQSLTTGSANTIVGAHSGDALTVGSFNALVGYKAGSAMVEDRNCVAVGYHALEFSNGGGSDGNATDTNNTAVGAFAGDSITSGTGNTLLGANADVSANNSYNELVLGSGVTGQGANCAVIGNASVTDVYMGQDANTGTAQTEGANVLARSGYFKAVGLDHDKSGTDGVGDMENILLTLHGAYDDDAIGGRGIGMSFKMQDESTNVGEVGRISMIPRSGNMNSNLSAYGTEMYFYNSVGGTLTKQMEIEGGDSHARVSIFSNTSTHGLIVKNDGNNANRDGIYIQAGADDGSGTTAYIDCQDGDGNQVGHISNTSGTFALTDVSDKRLKKNIVDTSVKGVETIEKMKVRDFEWIKSGDKMTAGFVAQELAEAFPSAVTGEDGAMEDILDDDYKKIGERIKPMGVSRDLLVPVLIKAVQELSARVKELEGK